MDMVVGNRCPDGAELFVRFPRAMDTQTFPTRPFLAFLICQQPSTLVKSVSTLASHRAAILVVVVRGEHDEWMQSATLVVFVVGREGQEKDKQEEEEDRNDEQGGGGAAVATTISATLVLVRVCLCGLLLLLLSPRRTCVDLPSFLDRFLAAVEFVWCITDDESWAMRANNEDEDRQPD